MRFTTPLDAISGAWWRVLAWLGVAMVLYLSLVPQQFPEPLQFWNSDKLVHMAMYASLMGCFSRAYGRHHWLLIAGALAVFGLSVELLQSLTPTRQASALDECANILGIVIMLWSVRRTPVAAAPP